MAGEVMAEAPAATDRGRAAKAARQGQRMLAVWCPDWPVVAASAAGQVSAHQPAAVFLANRVVASSAIARNRGVRRGMRRREAQSVCPELAVFPDDPARDARLFEPVAVAVEELVVGVEVVRPGVVAVPVKGATRYFGDEKTLAGLLIERVAAAAGVECQVGVADGLFGALLAAHRSVLVDPGATAAFLAPLSVTELDQPGSDRTELVDLLRRLGLRTLGAFAALTERDVNSRFGHGGLVAHRLARGLSERPPLRRTPPPELSVTEPIDPPLDRIDAAAFLAKTVADRFHGRLASRGLACTRLGIHARTETGEEYSRVWRCAEPLTPQGIADRVRWQFEGWLRAAPDQRPRSGIVQLRLEPSETIAGEFLQLGLWQRTATGFRVSGEDTAFADEQAGRAFVRVQGLLGPRSVFTAVLDGGRGPAERVRLVPWGDERTLTGPPDAPWPGRLPRPSPSTVFERPISGVRVIDEAGDPVRITGRQRLARPPHRVAVAGGPPRAVLGWAGPWVVDGEAWVPNGRDDMLRLQVLLANLDDRKPPVAILLTGTGLENPQWTVEGMYD